MNGVNVIWDDRIDWIVTHTHTHTHTLVVIKRMVNQVEILRLRLRGIDLVPKSKRLERWDRYYCQMVWWKNWYTQKKNLYVQLLTILPLLISFVLFFWWGTRIRSAPDGDDRQRTFVPNSRREGRSHFVLHQQQIHTCVLNCARTCRINLSKTFKSCFNQSQRREYLFPTAGPVVEDKRNCTLESTQEIQHQF